MNAAASILKEISTFNNVSIDRQPIHKGINFEATNFAAKGIERVLAENYTNYTFTHLIADKYYIGIDDSTKRTTPDDPFLVDVPIKYKIRN